MYSATLVCIALSIYAAYKDYVTDIKRDPKLRTKNILILVLHYHLRGLPLRSKLLLYFCLAIFIYGKYHLFVQWQKLNTKEIVLSKRQKNDSLHRDVD
jgi:hypothetical protein